ncbi:MAG: hypothetical protein A2Z25_11850 [Planctomycetes bacterium RBG_16_55_9]|nr:MAG: hypothetical protein A2Z25_11850 [Planctomycetes bacterium RBG_16_55_9]
MTINNEMMQMSLISNGIESVRAIGLPSGIRADGTAPEAPRVALVKWKSIWNDKFHQVYINGRFAGNTLDCQQRQMIVPVPTSLETPVRIEVFAVETEDASIDFSGELVPASTNSGRVRIVLLRSQALPMGATVDIYCDSGTGTMDYDHPLNESPIRIWPTWQDKAGFGMAGFGFGDFGYDAGAAVGFGKGSFGRGQFGLDADTIEWTSPPLPAGVYLFGVKVKDKSGHQSTPGETEPIAVTPAPRPAEKLSVSSFDGQTNQLVLQIENSA